VSFQVARARDGDRKQARQKVNYFVTQGRLPRPCDLPCVDCGHVWADGERRHEYDHHLGYGADHQFDVEAVCTSCHHKRSLARGEGGRGGCPRNIVFLVPRPGDKNPAAKLTWEQVRLIRACFRSGEKRAAIALSFGISQSQVSNIVWGRCWKEESCQHPSNG
jgi:hypothetical protein